MSSTESLFLLELESIKVGLEQDTLYILHALQFGFVHSFFMFSKHFLVLLVYEVSAAICCYKRIEVDQE